MGGLATSIETVNKAYNAYCDACMQVWACIEQDYSDVGRWVRDLGFTGEQAALWLCAPHHRWSVSPAEVIASGRSDEVITLLQQSYYGVCA